MKSCAMFIIIIITDWIKKNAKNWHFLHLRKHIYNLAVANIQHVIARSVQSLAWSKNENFTLEIPTSWSDPLVALKIEDFFLLSLVTILYFYRCKSNHQWIKSTPQTITAKAFICLSIIIKYCQGNKVKLWTIVFFFDGLSFEVEDEMK